MAEGLSNDRLHVGEIVASSTTRFTAQCPDEDCVPPYGAFVTVDAPPGRAMAVVADVRASTLDAHRRPVAYGLPDDQLYAQQPQLRELLSTEFDAILVGFCETEWRQLLPPRPPRLHRFVAYAEPGEIRAVTATGDYLHTLTAAEASDDLLAAAVRASLEACDAGEREAAMVACGQALARLLDDDYGRLQVLLRRIQR